MRISVLGLGAMGHALASRLLDLDHEVTVWNRSPGKSDDLAGRGARVAATPAEAATEAQVVLSVLTDDAAVRSVVVDGGVLDALADDAVLADVSTTSVALARELAGLHPRVLDTPVLGSPTSLQSGKGVFFVGGDRAAVDATRPLWDTVGARWVDAGTAGSAAALKLATNLQLVIGVAGFAEALAVTRAAGVDDELFRTAMDGNPTVSPATGLRIDAVLDPEHPGWFSAALAAKDVRLVRDQAAEAGVDVALAPAALELLERVADKGWPDFAALVEGLSR